MWLFPAGLDDRSLNGFLVDWFGQKEGAAAEKIAAAKNLDRPVS